MRECRPGHFFAIARSAFDRVSFSGWTMVLLTALRAVPRFGKFGVGAVTLQDIDGRDRLAADLVGGRALDDRPVHAPGLALLLDILETAIDDRIDRYSFRSTSRRGGAPLRPGRDGRPGRALRPRPRSSAPTLAPRRARRVSAGLAPLRGRASAGSARKRRARRSAAGRPAARPSPSGRRRRRRRGRGIVPAGSAPARCAGFCCREPRRPMMRRPARRQAAHGGAAGAAR